MWKDFSGEREMKKSWHQKSQGKEGLLIMSNAKEKTSQIKTEVVIGFDGEIVIAILGKSFDGMGDTERKLW